MLRCHYKKVSESLVLSDLEGPPNLTSQNLLISHEFDPKNVQASLKVAAAHF